MPFDKSFFDVIRSLTESHIASVTPPGFGLRPTVPQLHTEGRVSSSFLMTTAEFVRHLNIRSKNKYTFDPGFRVYPQHIANFSSGRAFRKQLNVALSAGTNENEDYVRIGVGFSLNKEFKQEGCVDYWEFQAKVKNDPSRFDRTFSMLGNYYEYVDGTDPNGFCRQSSLSSSWVIADNPNYNDAWRFFGKALYWKTDANVISDPDLIIDEVIKVFDQIRSAGYY